VAVTAGPGVTNALTAVKNAQLAQTPLVLLGGATATMLRGRGALQDIDQLALMRPVTKWATAATSLPGLGRALERACRTARQGVPGPVFVEAPVDLLYPEALVREWYAREAGRDPGLAASALRSCLAGHLWWQFRAPAALAEAPPPAPRQRVAEAAVALAARALRGAARPVILVGSQAVSGLRQADQVAAALEAIGAPVFLSGMARGLLGRAHPLHLRHRRSEALGEADLVLACGVPLDFRLGYGRAIPARTRLVAANLSAAELRLNRRPDVAARTHAGRFLVALAGRLGPAAGRWAGLPGPAPERWPGWLDRLRAGEAAREAELSARARPAARPIDPLHLLQRLEAAMGEDAVVVADGGDFVAAASYLLRPRGPLGWLDPGAFGTLGAGGGFALGAALARPGRETWLLWGDGSCAYSLAEVDTFVRHGVAPIAVVGNDACWSQIAREQVEQLGTALGCELRRTAYHEVAAGYGGVGIEVTDPARIDEALAEAKAVARGGRPVCLNVQLGTSDLRKGSISM
jgi:acetolactate synthase-1/2/3 large subunit